MGFMTPDVTDERDALATFAHHSLDQVATALYGLGRDQLAATPSASAMSLGALARHCIQVAENIIGGVQDAPAPNAGAVRDREVGIAEGTIAPSALRADDDAELLIAELRERGRDLEAAIRAADPDEDVPIPDMPWFKTATRWNVRWSALHASVEFARHAGHADIIRESLDGKGAYELNALADGEPWPPEWE